MAESSYLDRPADDNTPKAHPAFNRGKVSGIRVMLKILKDLVSGKDNGSGTIGSTHLETLRRAILVYRTALEVEAVKSKKASNALKEATKLVENIKL